MYVQKRVDWWSNPSVILFLSFKEPGWRRTSVFMRLPNQNQNQQTNMVELASGQENLNKSENGQDSSSTDSGVPPSPASSQQSSERGSTSTTGALTPSASTSNGPNSPTTPSKQRNIDGTPGTPTSKQTVLISRRSVGTPPPGPVVYTPKENEFGPNFKILPVSCQIRELQTIIRDK